MEWQLMPVGADCTTKPNMSSPIPTLNMSPNISSFPEETDVVQGIMDLIKEIATFGDFRRTQRKEATNLLRRIKLLMPLFEEINEMDILISDAVYSCLLDLMKALASAKKLLKKCRDGSKIYLAFEGESVMSRFHNVYEKLSYALDSIAYDELGISDEVKEQVDLMSVQLQRAKSRTDTQDIELAMDMMVGFSKKEDRNADIAIHERLAKKLELHTIPDLQAETTAVRKLITERNGKNAESTQQIVDLLKKFKQIAGLDDSDVTSGPAACKTLEKSQSLAIPHEFLCPIKLEIMADPVIVASGQTYERESIQKWFDSNHRTCPKTRETLCHVSVAPNYALRNLILQWCEKNNFQLPKKEDPLEATSSSTEHKKEISSLVKNLCSIQLDVQRKAVTKIRLLSKENPENRIMIAKCGGISPLIQLLCYPDSKIRQHAVTALLNMSIDETNKRLIAREEGAIQAIIEVLQNGTVEAKENSAACLFSLSMLDENKVRIGSENGIPPLVNLLKTGTVRGKKDAATALFNLSLNQANKARAIEAGIVAPLLRLAKDRNVGMVDEALSILLLLASHPEGREAIGLLTFIKTLVEFIKDGSPKNKECAASVLHELISNNSSFAQVALQHGVHEHLVELTRSGTNRAQRKANSLLNLMSKCEQSP